MIGRCSEDHVEKTILIVINIADKSKLFEDEKINDIYESLEKHKDDFLKLIEEAFSTLSDYEGIITKNRKSQRLFPAWKVEIGKAKEALAHAREEHLNRCYKENAVRISALERQNSRLEETIGHLCETVATLIERLEVQEGQVKELPVAVENKKHKKKHHASFSFK